jgi:hypothetical protein
MTNALQPVAQPVAQSVPVAAHPIPAATQPAREDFRDYVAQLQLHMTLQAKNLVTTGEVSFTTSGLHLLGQSEADRFPLLQATQAMAEKLASRQR